MKIGILSDTHIGYPRFYDDSIKQAREAFVEACNNSDVVLIAGDIFDTKTPKFEVIAHAMEILNYGKGIDWKGRNITVKLGNDGKNNHIPVIAIHGTHDRRSKEMINPVQLLEKSGLITNISDKGVLIEKRNGEKIERVYIFGIGGTSEDSIRKTIQELNPKPMEGAYNILMLHQTITDVIPVAEGISLDELPPGFDLYLCGHIHKRVVMEKNGRKLLIPGSTVLTQLKKEEEEPRAYVILDTESKEIEFINIKSRPFKYGEIEVNGKDSQEILRLTKEKIESLLNEVKETNRSSEELIPIIRVIVKGTLKEGIKRENIGFNELSKQYEDICILQIDNELNEQGLKEKLDNLRKMYEQKLSVREIGSESIKKKLQSTEAKDLDVEFLMNMLQDDDNIELVLEELIKKEKSKIE